MEARIFYSWQSDLPAETNHSFIQNALEKAVESLHSTGEVKVEPVVDRDTIGVPGSPDIAAAVFGKIDKAAIVVCDVSIVHRVAQGRCFPNPNVLVELGYAWKALTQDRVILVFNEAFGSTDELPFDLRTKRVQTYRLSEGERDGDKALSQLSSDLGNAVRDVLDWAERSKRVPELNAFLEGLTAELVTLIIYADQFNDRALKPWIDYTEEVFKKVRDDLRSRQAEHTADELEVTSSLNALIDDLEAILSALRTLAVGDWQPLVQRVGELKAKAEELFARLIADKPTLEDSLEFIRKQLSTDSRLLRSLATQASKAQENEIYDHLENLQNKAADVGYQLLRMGYYNLDELRPGLGPRLREVGRELHLFYVRDIWDSIEDFVQDLTRLASSLEVLVAGIPK